jgi:hypothetical protein
MIEYFNIPSGALINTPISKKLFAEKAPLSSGEKRLLREEIEKLTMKGLLQTRTIGLAAYMDEEQAYDQIIIAEVSIKVATMVQKAFPAPMFLVIHCDEGFSVNWCVKRINQADRTRRVMEEQQITRFFVPEGDDSIIRAWLPSLDIARIRCNSLKELFEALANRLLMLAVSDEAGIYLESDRQKTEQYRVLLEQLNTNRMEQKRVKAETQFNLRLKLTTKLKELQQQEKILKNQLI